jgi:glucose-1-phosphate thymidylyltransferase
MNDTNKNLENGDMKGIILAGGSGTRLYPVTLGVCKQLLPIYDKPMIYYPLSVLMLSGIRDILIISTPQDLQRFVQIFGDGSRLGLNFSYKEQPRPGGIAEAFILGEKFIGSNTSCLVLGDNIFYGHGLTGLLKKATTDVMEKGGATIFGYYVNDPERYGVVEFDEKGNALSIEEKPKAPKSKYAVTGLYFYDEHVAEYAATLKPSQRGELEITDLNRIYLEKNALHVEKLGRGIAWLDTGTHESFVQATNFIQIIEQRQGLKIACLEEIAFRMGYISKEKLEEVAQTMRNSTYGDYLQRIVREQEG